MTLRTLLAGKFAFVFALLVLASQPASAITYNINVSEGGNSVTGTITTNGHLGSLASTDITAWNLTINAGLGGHLTLGNGNPTMIGSPLLAGTTTLDFARSGSAEVIFGDGFNDWLLIGAVLSGTPGGEMQFVETGGGGSANHIVSLPPEDPFAGHIGSADFTPPADTPVPTALPLFATGLGALGLIGWRRKRKQAA
jgi:hypothetical protein